MFSDCNFIEIIPLAILFSLLGYRYSGDMFKQVHFVAGFKSDEPNKECLKFTSIFQAEQHRANLESAKRIHNKKHK